MKTFRASGYIAAAFLVFLALAALFPAVLAPGDPLQVHPLNAFQPPSFSHLFGTDESGRDIYTRVIHGAGPSVAIGLSATGIGVGLAMILGFAAGLGPRWLDFTTTRFVEVLFAFPGLLMALLFIVIYGPGVTSSVIAVGLATAPGYARIIRSQVRSIARSEYIDASVVLGRSRPWIVGHHIVPNATAALFVLATLGFGQSIVWVSSLGYLGLGAAPPQAEWGAMLAAGRIYISGYWWMTIFPGLFIVLSAAASTLVGREIQRKKRLS